MADKEFTYSDVSEHNTKKDLYIVVHDKVYDATSFVDEHPYVGNPLSARPQAPRVHTVCFETPRLRANVLQIQRPQSANMYTTEVVRKFSLMSAARTQPRPSRTSVTQTRLARSSMACSLEL